MQTQPQSRTHAVLWRRPKFMFFPILLTVTYAFGIPAFVAFWLRRQFLPGFYGLEPYGLLYASLALFGLVSNVALVYGRRWGIFAQVGTWLATGLVNGLLHNIHPEAMTLALVIAGLWGVEVYRNRSWFH